MTKDIKKEAGRTGDPCKIQGEWMKEAKKDLASTRNKDEIKRLKNYIRELYKSGKQLGCDNKSKRADEKRGDYGGRR
jgi:hypothetical protein